MNFSTCSMRSLHQKLATAEIFPFSYQSQKNFINEPFLNAPSYKLHVNAKSKFHTSNPCCVYELKLQYKTVLFKIAMYKYPGQC